MQAHRTHLRPVLRCPVRSGSRRDPRRRPTTRRAAGVLALLHSLLLAAPPASHSATTFLGEAPTAGGDVTAGDPAPAAGSPRERAVFICEQDGVPVFTDRPCGSAAEQRKLTVDAPAPGAAPGTAPPRPRASTRPRHQPEGQVGPGRTAESRCAALRRQLDELDARMRDGYSSREAARLWTRWRDLKGRLRAERC